MSLRSGWPWRWVLSIGLGLALVALLIPLLVRPNGPPEAPVIVDPPAMAEALAALRLELAPFRDRDGDTHQATDWEIRDEDDALVWAAHGSSEAIHVALGEGIFQGPAAAVQRLNYGVAYRLRVRVQDARGVWSVWSERPFISPETARVPPWRGRGILAQPAPRWRTDGDSPIILPAKARLTLEADTGATWLALAAAGDRLLATPGALLDAPASLRLRLTAPDSAPLQLPTSRLMVVGVWADRAERLTIVLPALQLESGAEQALWVSQTGATFYAAPDATTFDAERLARDVPIPWQAPPGYRVEAVTTALQLPASMAFVANPGTDPAAPRFYVTELYGRIKVVTNDGRALPFADELLNLMPSGVFPGSGEMGVIGICLPPDGHDVYATMIYRDRAGNLRNKLSRLRSNDGLTVRAIEDVLVVQPGQGLARAAHQIQQCSFGPDGKLYVSIGDGKTPDYALSDRSFGGKVLRLNPDGSAPPDNPFYDPAQPDAPISYIYIKGLRNAFGQTWRAADGQLYLSDNGPNVDRLVRAVPGRSYGWNGSDASMRTNALYLWPESRWSPVGLTFVDGPGAVAFPPDRHGQLLVASSGLVHAKGTLHAGKAIQAFTLDADGQISQPPARFVSYTGEGHSSIIDLKLQPDGLYFTNLYRDDGDGGAPTPGGQVWRIRYVGTTAFELSTRQGRAPLNVALRATSTPAAARDCVWDFGDGQTSTEANPSHAFAQPGVYAVSLTCVDASGQPTEQLALVTVTDRDGRIPAPGAEGLPVPIFPAAPAVTFPETGMTLTGHFKQFWETHGGLTTFGYPITPLLREPDPTDGRENLVQYFERARFAAPVTAPEGIELATLGRRATAGRQQEPAFQPLVGGALESTPERLVFAETRHSLSSPFRQWWEDTGGATVYGLPISEAFHETSPTDDKPYLVQYFERGRMEYHPEHAGTDQAIRLARLGTAIVVSQPAP